MIIGWLLLYTTAVTPGGWASLKKQYIVNTYHQLEHGRALRNALKCEQMAVQIVGSPSANRSVKPQRSSQQSLFLLSISCNNAVIFLYHKNGSLVMFYWQVRERNLTRWGLNHFLLIAEQVSENNLWTIQQTSLLQELLNVWCALKQPTHFCKHWKQWSWFYTISRFLNVSIILQPRCQWWQSFSSRRSDTRKNTRQCSFCCVVCGIRMTESLSLKTNERHRNLGILPSAPNCYLGAAENRAILGQHGQTWALL